MSEFLLPIAIITGLILINGLFVAAEFAIVSAPYTRIAQRADEGSWAAQRTLAILRDPARSNMYIATAQIGITAASLGLGMYGEHTIAAWLLGPMERYFQLSDAAAHSIALVLAISLLTYLHVVVGEMVPKSMAIQYAESSVLRLSMPMHFIGRALEPAVRLLNAMGNAITRMLGVPPAHGHERLFSAQELAYIVEESFEGGKMKQSEQIYLENIFDFQERAVDQVMTPRTRMIGIPITASESQVLQIVCTTRKTRYPIYDRDMDHILGILHVKSLARQQVNRSGQFDLNRLLRPALYVPESVALNEMRQIFRDQKISLAIVMDEYGGTAGLVTVEDLVEEVVGEILDEFDQETPPIQELEPGRILVRGDLLLDELDQHYDLALSREEVDTVGGLIMTLLGRLPEAGDVVEQGGVTFKVQTVAGRAVDSALIQMPSEESAGSPEPDAELSATADGQDPSEEM